MKKRRLVKLLLTILVLVACSSVAVGDNAENTPFTYTDTVTGVMITGIDSSWSADALVIPDELGHSPVTQIADNAFSGMEQISSVSFPKSLNTIGSGAFSGCTNLKSVKLPASLRLVREGAFQNCTSLTDVIISNDVTKISANAFSGCTSLRKMTTFQPTTVTGLTLEPEKITNLARGGKQTLTAVISPTGASNDVVIWSSEDSTIASVDHGTVTGIAKGSTVIHCTSADDPDKTVTCAVTVVAPALVSLSVEDMTAVPLDATSMGFTIALTPEDAEPVLTAVSDDESVVTVLKPTAEDPGWYVVPQSVGTTKVTVSADNNVYTEFQVTVICEHPTAKLQSVEGSAADCGTETPGLEAHLKCELCGALFREQEEGKLQLVTEDDLKIPFVHRLTAYEARTLTCTQDGNPAYWQCDICHGYFLDEEGKTKTTEQEIFSKAQGHIYGEEIPEVEKCEETGTAAHYECSVCHLKFVKGTEPGEMIQTTDDELVTEPKGHVYGELIPEVSSTCVVKGTAAHYECSRCDGLFIDDADAKKPVSESELELSLADHIYGDIIPEEPATCTVDGKEAYCICTVCESFFAIREEEKVKVDSEEDLVIGKHHTEVTDEEIPATETTHGETAGTHCSVCKAILSGHEVIHYSVEDEEVPASCTQTGKTAGTHCAVCKENLSGNEVIGLKEHDFSDTSSAEHVDATLTEGGYDEVQCANCTATTKINETEPGAKWGELTCVLDEENGTLTITGSGAMPDSAEAPWQNDTWRNQVKQVVIGDGIITVSANAFANCSNLSAATVSDTVAMIGEKAFASCALTEIKLSEHVTSIADDAFDDNDGLIIDAPKGSPAAEYAASHGMTKPTPTPSPEPTPTPTPKPEPTPEPASALVTSFGLNKAKATLYQRKDTKNRDILQLTAMITTVDGSVPAITWTSNKPKIAKVDGNGLVTAIKKGTADITATVQDGDQIWTATCRITVKKLDKKVTKITAKPKKLTLKKGEKGTVNLTFKPTGVFNNKVKWSTSDKKVATVSKDGVITAKKKGKCTISATSTDKSGKKVTIKVTVK